jgi:hypothetical protein
MVHVPEGDWISVKEAAEIIGTEKRNVLNYIGAGLLAAVRIGDFWIVQRKDAKAFTPPARGRPPKKPRRA